ncbi:MAG: SIS domain-containing protein [Candidatus Atribacteria bacterium]|nr:MAG: SIS domain-containing protein [Candidatus Atribacteria bacterium]
MILKENYSIEYLKGIRKICEKIKLKDIEDSIDILINVRKKRGRLFILGVGGSAGSATHAVNDFRKIAGIECYTPTDNVSELTARINDEGWNTVFKEWLKTCNLNNSDCILILSVGGGDKEKNISVNIIEAINYAKEVGSKVIGIVGRNGGYTAKNADKCILIPVINDEMITPFTESFHSVLCHLLVSHPRLKINQMKWESIK